MNGPALALSVALQATRPDTVVMVPVRDAFDWIQAGVLVLVLLATVVTVLILFRVLSLLGSLRKAVDPLVEQTQRGLEPVLDSARNVSENVDYVSRAVREDVEGMTEAVERIRRRLDQASDRMEERIEEFNALMEVVQDEAEEIFVDTASAVRGVRAGARSLQEGPGEPDVPGRGPEGRRSRRPPASRKRRPAPSDRPPTGERVVGDDPEAPHGGDEEQERGAAGPG